jgi:glycosyltransferase involved in cell wall biosynthesis
VPETVALPIAIVMSHIQPGGTEGQMIELVRRLDRKRWQVHVGCFGEGGTWTDRVRDCAPLTSFDVHSLKPPAAARRARAFARWCIDRRIALVHSTDLPSNIFAMPAAALARIPVRIANRRDVNPGLSPLALAAQRVAYGFAHHVVANCKAAARRLQAERVPACRISVVPNGVDLDRSSAAGPRALRRRVVVVANLRPEKGQDVLLDAAAAVLARVPDASFELVGGGPCVHDLQRQASALGISHAVTFSGHCDDVPARLRDADIFVLPSRSEAFPNALLEAMAAGLPCVASSVGGVPELIDDGRTGLLTPPGSAPALADALLRLMAAPESGNRLGDAARAAVSARYSFERMVASFEQIYTNQLARCGVPASAEFQLAAH